MMVSHQHTLGEVIYTATAAMQEQRFNLQGHLLPLHGTASAVLTCALASASFPVEAVKDSRKKEWTQVLELLDGG